MSGMWPTAALRSILSDPATYGVVQPGNHDPRGVPMLRVKDVRNGVIDACDPLRIAPSVEASYTRTRLQGHEVVVSLVGTVGESAVVPDELAGWNVARAIAVLRPRETSPEWLRICFTSGFVQSQVASSLNTTVQSTLNLKDLNAFRIPLPPPYEQRAIAQVLGALDDKIAANSRIQTATLSLADALFERALVRARFAGHTFSDLAVVSGGGTPRTSVEEYWGGDVLWATPTDVTALPAPYLASTNRAITRSGLCSCASALYPIGSILMTSRATIGAFAIAEAPMAVNQGFIVVNAHDPEMQWWLFHEMRSRVPAFVSHANGATFLELSRGKFKALPVRLPDSESARAFGRRVETLHASAFARMQESQQLAKVRDELLPLLMSGKVRVKDAEKIAEGVV